MRKLAIAAVVGMTCGTAMGGEYHAGSGSVCADCHTMRDDPEERATASALADGTWVRDAGAVAARLKASNETDLCLGCHDGQTWAPDVRGANTSSNVRSAGFITAVPHDGHTLGYKGRAPGGSFATSSLTCVSCHSPHGKRNAFRNLNSYALYDAMGDPTGYPQYYLSTTPFSADRKVTRGDVRIGIAAYAPLTGSNPAYYENANVFYENGARNALDAFCGKCHGTFHDDGGAGRDANQAATGRDRGHFRRHPTRREILQPPADGSYTTKVYASSVPGESYVGCLSCHRAHGTSHAFGLFHATPAGAGRGLDDTESGGEASGFQGLCGNCHAAGR